MNVTIKPSDLQFRYPRNKRTRHLPKFAGKPYPRPFDRDDLYEVIPMFEAVMAALETNDGRVLHRLEEVLNRDLPRCIDRREDIFDCLLETLRNLMRS